MSVAYVETDYTWVRLHGERLAVFSPHDDLATDHLLEEIPLLSLERLCLREHVQITTEALCTLFRKGVPVHFIDWKGDCLGSALAPSPSESACRMSQYRRTLDAGFVLVQSRAIIAAKVQNQLRLVQRLNANRPILKESDWQPMNELLGKIDSAPDLETLRGIEGRAAAVHYPLWAAFLPESFPFERRSTRPPMNAVNACLSFSSALLYHDVVAAVHTRGLDPGLGLLHTIENGRWSLALDLMEPFRPALCDALACRLLNHRMLNAADFEPREGGIYLNENGRKTLIDQYERRMDRPFLSEQIQHRTTLRQAVVDQVLSYKLAVLEGGLFTPFRLN
ncbi:MAG TPA: CRISPR-associated endonuclease Cas1 [Candidatus Limnocylindria bacterium]|jgi:CRISPR-associated protein Cas1|nr:CRISPR-associated endonuclease Cas1 [Candidatus Limnocylindria bacterium]